MTPLSVAFLLFPNVTQLDLTGPAQVLSRLGNAKIDLVWKSRDPVMTDAGFAILPTAAFADISRADILCVPGGVGVTDVMMDEAAGRQLKLRARVFTGLGRMCCNQHCLSPAEQDGTSADWPVGTVAASPTESSDATTRLMLAASGNDRVVRWRLDNI